MLRLRTGNQLLVKGSTTQTYVVERLYRQKGPLGMNDIIVEGRPRTHQSTDRTITGYKAWTWTYVLACLRAGSMEILADLSSP